MICGPGGAGGGLYDWYVNPSEVSRPTVDELVSTTGAIIIGRVSSAPEITREAAGDRYATIGGGADIARQCLAEHLVDEVQLHVVPVLLGDGIQLFDRSGARWSLTKTRGVVDAPNVTHLRYRVDCPTE